MCGGFDVLTVSINASHDHAHGPDNPKNTTKSDPENIRVNFV